MTEALSAWLEAHPVVAAIIALGSYIVGKPAVQQGAKWWTAWIAKRADRRLALEEKRVEIDADRVDISRDKVDLAKVLAQRDDDTVQTLLRSLDADRAADRTRIAAVEADNRALHAELAGCRSDHAKCREELAGYARDSSEKIARQNAVIVRQQAEIMEAARRIAAIEDARALTRAPKARIVDEPSELPDPTRPLKKE